MPRSVPGLRAAVLIGGLAGATTGAAMPWLADATAEAGLAFTHHAARSGAWRLPETMGSGVALLDLDRDGDLDVLLLDSGNLPGTPALDGQEARHALYRNVSAPGKLRFEVAPAPPLSGLAAMGACTGDVDRDGDDDVYVTGLPAGRLLLNDGGALVETRMAGLDDPGWGSSCVLFDPDQDGDLDLHVVHYVQWSAASEPACGGERRGFRSYCPPDRYQPEQDRLFRNDGARFTDVTAAAGLAPERGSGLGVVAADVNGDGLADLYVANDQTPSSLWLNRGQLRFEDVGLAAGVALSEAGKSQAGMGVDAGDADGDGDIDFVKTNFDLEGSNLYLAQPRRGAALAYRDASTPSGLCAASLPMLGFGTVLADLDGDGDLDVFSSNGHILPNVAEVRGEQSQAMRSQLLENLGLPGAVPRLRDARDRWMPASAATSVGRGLAAGDLDSDGDLDLVETRNGGEARLLRNDSNPRGWVGLALVTTTSAPGAPGASVSVGSAIALRRTGGSYLSASDPRVLVVPPRNGEPVVVRWPTGRREAFDVPTRGAYVTLIEGQGRTASPLGEGPAGR